MTENKYVEYTRWVPMWGLFLSSEKEVNKFMDKNNKGGWKVVQFQWTTPTWSIGRLFKILFVTAITLGFMSYWSGFSIIFEKETK